jgi:biotin carboxyl carrier protein
VESFREKLIRVSGAMCSSRSGQSVIKATMPGLVVRIAVEVGTEVKKGDPILILEAMKMENEIRSQVDGTVREIRVKEKNSVEKGDILALIE